MKNLLGLFLMFYAGIVFAQTGDEPYKKRVLENVEIDIISSFYSQDGDNAAVTGGIGTEELTDLASKIVISIPLNDNDVLTIDGSFSAYSSASSSNLNPFDRGNASVESDKNVGGGNISAKTPASRTNSAPINNDNDDDDDTFKSNGSPWVESSGASKSDLWASGNVGYSHSSDDRNTVIGANINFASEYDYTSLGFGGSFTKLLNQKNTEISINVNAYIDNWQPEYPSEITSYLKANGNLNASFFQGVDILNQNGEAIDKNIPGAWSPLQSTLIENTSRNTYAASFSFSQILSKKAQISIFFDLVQQNGWLANPMQRVYFADKANFYIGNEASIPNYTSPSNKDVFQLADDIERLPDSRFKIPVGMRFNYYINEIMTLRTYYRYYYDDWGITSHTASLELPIKLSDKFTFYPSYRYYNQSAADYFAPFEQQLSTAQFYTSDYDLSEFSSNQFGLGFSYTDIFTKARIWKLGLKSIDLKYDDYKRNTGLKAGIISLGFKFIMD